MFILRSDARTSLLALGIFALLACYFCLKKAVKSKLYRIYAIALLASLTFVFVYLLMYESGFMVGEKLLGKNFYTGRQRIWTEALGRFKQDIFFGFSNKITYTELQHQSAHNSLLAVMCYFGLFGLAIHVVVMIHCFKRLDVQISSIATAALLSVTLVMAFETVLIDWSLMWPLCMLFLNGVPKTEKATEAERPRLKKRIRLFARKRERKQKEYFNREYE